MANSGFGRIHARRGKHQRITLAALQLAQSRVQVPSHRDINKIVAQSAQLRLSPQTAGGNAGAGGQVP